MGSFTSKPQQGSEECEGDRVEVPDGVVGRDDLLEWVQKPLSHLPPLLPRVYHYPPPTSPDPSSQPPSDSFRVMQWNILAQGPKDITSEGHHLGTKNIMFEGHHVTQVLMPEDALVLLYTLGTHADNFIKCPPEALDWNNRKYRIMEEVLTHLPQLICFQEVDHYGFLERVVERLGYRGVFMPKPDSPCLYLPNNNGPDGCAVFWDDTRFRLVTKTTRVVEVWHVQSNQVAILLVLEERSSGRQLAVLTTHLKARQGALLSSLRNEQGKDLLSFLDKHCSGRPIIVCGDFNAEPTEPVYTTMTDDTTGLKSAYYFLHNEKEPTYSTWKVRGEVDCCHNLDYIFYTPDKLTVEGGVDVPTEESLGPGRAPSLSYPSDHFSLICDFTFKPEPVVEEPEAEEDTTTSHL